MKTPTYAEFLELTKLPQGEQDSWEYRFHRLALALWNYIDLDYEEREASGQNVYREEEDIKSYFKHFIKESIEQLK